MYRRAGKLLVCIKEGWGHDALVCFPYAGGGVAAFHPWLAHIPGELSVYVSLLPGRESKFAETLMTDMGSIVDAAVNDLRALNHSRFTLFGHSMGGQVAYLTAVALEKLRIAVQTLFVSASKAPVFYLAENRRPLSQDKTVSKMNDIEFKELLTDLEGTPHEILENEEILNLVLPYVRADFEIIENHSVSAEDLVVLKVPIIACFGTDDPKVELEHIAKWGDVTSSSFEVHPIQGGHFYLEQQKEGIVKKVVSTF